MSFSNSVIIFAIEISLVSAADKLIFFSYFLKTKLYGFNPEKACSGSETIEDPSVFTGFNFLKLFLWENLKSSFIVFNLSIFSVDEKIVG